VCFKNFFSLSFLFTQDENFSIQQNVFHKLIQFSFRMKNKSKEMRTEEIKNCMEIYNSIDY
jgi:hypothetical protein